MNQNDCSDCGARTWKAEQGIKGQKWCCDAGKTEIPAPDCDFNDFMPIDYLMSEVELEDNGKVHSNLLLFLLLLLLFSLQSGLLCQL